MILIEEDGKNQVQEVVANLTKQQENALLMMTWMALMSLLMRLLKYLDYESGLRC